MLANGKIVSKKIFKNIYIQPAAGDAGGSLGAALAYWHIGLNKERNIQSYDNMNGSYLGPEYTNEYIKNILDKSHLNYSFFETEEASQSIKIIV